MSIKCLCWRGFAASSFLLAGACGSSEYADVTSADAQEFVSGSSDTSETASDEEMYSEGVEFDEDTARQDAEQGVASEGYSGPCTSDCSGHDAGFGWSAEGHDYYGASRSQSFDEGQEAYDEAVAERVHEKRSEFEDEGADSEYADQQ